MLDRDVADLPGVYPAIVAIGDDLDDSTLTAIA
jgi:hypothetical protein